MTTQLNNDDTLQPLPRRERLQSMLKPLLMVFAVSLLAFAFAKLGSEVSEGETHGFDMLMLQAAQAMRLAERIFILTVAVLLARHLSRRQDPQRHAQP